MDPRARSARAGHEAGSAVSDTASWRPELASDSVEPAADAEEAGTEPAQPGTDSAPTGGPAVDAAPGPGTSTGPDASAGPDTTTGPGAAARPATSGDGAAPSADHPEELDTQENNPIAIEDELEEMGLEGAREIGHGGFGVVYRCVQRALDRVVAVKVLSSDIDAESRERFLREEHAMGRLSGHPNIVDILQVDVTATGRPFIVMPYATRGSLEVVVRDNGPLGWSDTLRAGVKLAGAIESAHRAGILHRDVKPANILLSSYGEPQLTDFGIARVPGGFRTSSSMITGSPAFTAPEVLKGDEPTVRSDVYGLGATLFALLTGHAAFERQAGEKVVAQFLRITTQPVPDLREQDIPADVAAAIEQAMAQNPRDRPASAYEFGEMLRAIQRTHGQMADEMALLDTEDEAEAAAAPSGNRTGPAVTARRSWPLNLSPPTPRPGYDPAPTTTFPPTAATKFRPPTPAREPVQRTRLLDILRTGGRRRLALIHAPAGFGKSTLAAQWRGELTADGVAVAWIGIDSDDDNEIWFLAHLIEAIRRVRPDIGTGLDQVLEEQPADAVAYAITTLIDDVHAGGATVVVVVDDWHRITDPGTRRVMDSLLDNGCHHLRFVVTSRDQSGLPISRMRVRDELVGIGSAELRLTREETRQILVDRNRFTLDDAQIDELHRATDGWPAAVQLISLALRGNPDPDPLIQHLAEGGHGVREYLAENVIDALEPRMVDFLTAISIAEKVSGSLAAALSDDPEAEHLLEQAEQRELFVRRVEYDPEWFRVQPLFAEHLRARLERTDPARVKVLHRKAARWYAEHQLLRKSVDHAVSATDLKMALDLLESGGMDLIDGSRLATLLGTVSKLPVQQVASRSKLLMAVARANVNLQQSGAARSALGRLSSVLSRGSSGDADVVRQRCQAAVLAAADQVARDHTEGVMDQIGDCLDHPDELPAWTVSTAANLTSFVRLCEFDFDGARSIQDWAAEYHERSKDPLGSVFGLCSRGAVAFEQLDIATAARCFQQAWDTARARSGQRSHAVRVAAALLGELHYRRGELDAADRLLDESHELVARVGPIDFLISTFVIGARVKAVRGDMATAASRLAEGQRIAVEQDLPRLAAQVRAERVRLGPAAETSGPQTATERWNGNVIRDTGSTGHRLTGTAALTAEAEEIAAIRELLADGGIDDQDRAVRRARALYGRTHELHRPRAQLDTSLLLAECLAAAGWVGEAAAQLVPAVTTCAELDWTRPLLDAGPGVVAILRVLRNDLPSELPIRFVDELLA
ncbi:protein kinase [Nocardia cyriacigeorgica]|uniref:mitogen-activated protein kinase kinase n=1 Tax=Nocardia cyriacigeorgica TaxID=135487 RepID=A0A6P1DAF4_9NOCA|nr:protein kinase [Nocardia cyriacigeorgica]NEW47705.1 protein kinase [Nocardia cyriacigeorgica]NEW59177.1 protein kinase [Nocardia cyriacigeorgica]